MQVGGRGGRLVNHDQTSTGIDDTSLSSEAICNSTSTTLWATSSVYGTTEAAVAHCQTGSPLSVTGSQGKWGDASMMARGLASESSLKAA